MDIVDAPLRLKALKSTIEKKKPSNQQQILESLKKDFGIEATQAMISRDLKKLGVVTRVEEGKKVYALPGKETEKQMLQLSIASIAHNETMIVVTTLPGLASFVGEVIDGAGLAILGCLSGENTILVVPLSIKDIKKVFQELCVALYYTSQISGF